MFSFAGRFAWFVFALCLALLGLTACGNTQSIESNRLGFGISRICSLLEDGRVLVVSPGNIELNRGEILSRVTLVTDSASGSFSFYLSPIVDRSATSVFPGSVLSAESVEDYDLIPLDGIENESITGPGLWSLVFAYDGVDSSSILATEVEMEVEIGGFDAEPSDLKLVNSQKAFVWEIVPDECASR